MKIFRHTKPFSSTDTGFSILEIISSAAILGLVITLSYSFTNISEDVKSSSKLRISLAEILENDIEKFKSLSWGFLYNPVGTVTNSPCYRTSRDCNQKQSPVAPDIFSMQRFCLNVSQLFYSSLPANYKTNNYYFYPDPHYHQIFQGRSSRIRRSLELIRHPLPLANSNLSNVHRRELLKISYHLVTLDRRSEKLVLEAFPKGQRPREFFIRSYIMNLDAHAWCPSLS